MSGMASEVTNSPQKDTNSDGAGFAAGGGPGLGLTTNNASNGASVTVFSASVEVLSDMSAKGAQQVRPWSLAMRQQVCKESLESKDKSILHQYMAPSLIFAVRAKINMMAGDKAEEQYNQLNVSQVIALIERIYETHVGKKYELLKESMEAQCHNLFLNQEVMEGGNLPTLIQKVGQLLKNHLISFYLRAL